MLCASNEEPGIFTQGRSWNSLMKNIREVIECHFNIPSADAVRIMLDIDPAVTDNAEMPVVSGVRFAAMLSKLDYRFVRQRGSHMIFS